MGDFKNGGREWRPHGQPLPVRVHDFLDPALGKAIPYGVYDLDGVYDLAKNKAGSVSASTMTRRNVPSTRSGCGGLAWAGIAFRALARL